MKRRVQIEVEVDKLNPIALFAVRYPNPKKPGKFVSSGHLRSREKAEAYYDHWEAKGLKPVLIETACAGFAISRWDR